MILSPPSLQASAGTPTMMDMRALQKARAKQDRKKTARQMTKASVLEPDSEHPSGSDDEIKSTGTERAELAKPQPTGYGHGARVVSVQRLGDTNMSEAPSVTPLTSFSDLIGRTGRWEAGPKVPKVVVESAIASTQTLVYSL